MGVGSDRDLVFYELGATWIQYTREPADVPGGYRESYLEVDPEEVAHERLEGPGPPGLAAALEPYRRRGNLVAAIRGWCRVHRWPDSIPTPDLETSSSISARAREVAGPLVYDFASGCLYSRGKLIIDLAPQAKNQRALLGALQKVNWSAPTRVRPGDRHEADPPPGPESVPLSPTQLYEAARELNLTLRPTPYRIERDNAEVRWRRRPGRPR
jgi:hypothetical protein